MINFDVSNCKKMLYILKYWGKGIFMSKRLVFHQEKKINQIPKGHYLKSNLSLKIFTNNGLIVNGLKYTNS